MTLKRILPIAVIALTLSASVAGSQATEPATDASTITAATIPVMPTSVALLAIETSNGREAPIAGPRLDRARIGIAVQRETAIGAFVPTPQPSISRKRGVPQMIIGGAAILGGAIVGGDAGGIVSLAGLGYGLYGLYLYLQ